MAPGTRKEPYKKLVCHKEEKTEMYCVPFPPYPATGRKGQLPVKQISPPIERIFLR